MPQLRGDACIPEMPASAGRPGEATVLELQADLALIRQLPQCEGSAASWRHPEPRGGERAAHDDGCHRGQLCRTAACCSSQVYAFESDFRRLPCKRVCPFPVSEDGTVTTALHAHRRARVCATSARHRTTSFRASTTGDDDNDYNGIRGVRQTTTTTRHPWPKSNSFSRAIPP